MRTLRWLKRALYALMALVIVLLALVTAIAATETGSRWALNRAAEHLPVHYEGMSGNLLTGLDLDRIEYRLEDQRYRADELSFRWQPLALLYSAVSVQSLKAERVVLHLPPSSETSQTPSAASVDWPSLALPVRVELGNLDVGAIHVLRDDTDTRLGPLTGSVSLGTFNLRLSNLTLSGPDFRVAVTGRTALRPPYDSDLSLSGRYTLPAEGDEPTELAGQLTLSGDLNELEARYRMEAPARLSGEARLEPRLKEADLDPQLTLRAGWPEQSLPPSVWPAERPSLVSRGELRLEGWLDDYRLTLETRVTGEALGVVSARTQARGDRQGLALEPLTLELPRGRLAARGEVHWSPEPGWDLTVELSEMDPSALPVEALAAWPGRLSGRTETRGRLSPSGLIASVNSVRLAGQLRARALLLAGAAEYGDSRLDLSAFELALGDNRLWLDGSVADTLALEGRLNADALGQLDPRLAGELEARWQLTGPLHRPEGSVSAEGRDLAWGEHRVQTLTLDARHGERAYDLRLQAGPAQLAGQALERLELAGEGRPEAHQLSLSATADPWGELALTLDGGYRSTGWEGRITRLALSPPDPLRWQLRRPAALALSAERAELQPLCLGPERSRAQGEPETLTGQVCLEGQWQSGANARASARLDDLPLSLARRWLAPEVTLDGTLEGEATLDWPADAPPEAGLSLSTRDGALRYAFGDQDEEVFRWQRARLEGEWRSDRVTARLDNDWGELGALEASGAWRPADGELEGRLAARLSSLAPLEALVPRARELEGELNAGLKLGGTLQSPELTGELSLIDAGARVPEAGLHLQALNVTARALPERIELEGGFRSGEGQLTLSGSLTDPWRSSRRLEARLSGEQVRLLDTRELELALSPDLRLDATAERIDLTGEARIPRARARLQSLPESATRPSPDAVLEEEIEKRREQRGPAVHVDLALVLGDDVRFDGFGLESRLEGALEVLHSPERGTLTLGEVNVAEGQYTAYGQELTIERGRLIFQGPYENPGLDIRATRQADEITAGLEIGGTLQQPRSRVFSNPSLPESEAMAILFTGKPLSSGSSADGAMLINAVGGLGLERAGFITAEVADTLNLDEFRIQAEDNVTESSLHIGKYLTPRLFVRYVVGLFDQTSRVGLRYDLTEGLHLEAESGTTQSLDLIYRLER